MVRLRSPLILSEVEGSSRKARKKRSTSLNSFRIELRRAVIRSHGRKHHGEGERKNALDIKSSHDIVLGVKSDRINEFIAKFLSDLAKAIFTVGLVSQLFKDFSQIWRIILGTGFLILLILSILIHPKE